MARFLVGTVPFVGHVAPLAPITRKLVERGHEVRWYAASKFRSVVEATGARYVPMQAAPEFDDQMLDAYLSLRKQRGTLGTLKDIVKYFSDVAVGQVRDYRHILRTFPADVLFSDATFVGARWVHELGGPPWAAFNPMPMTLSSRDTAPFGFGLPPARSGPGRLRNRALRALFTRVLFRDMTVHADRVRAGVGLPPSGEFFWDSLLSPYLYMQGTIQAFEYSRSDLAPQIHFVGPALPVPPTDFTPPAWWGDLQTGRPVVHVTQGTIAIDPEELLVPTLRALACEDVLVVATTGGKPVRSIGLAALPDNARAERFIPHVHLLPHVDVMVTNGGYNGVQTALANGVPLVAAGTSEDKMEVSARVAWAGVGLAHRTARPKEEGVRRSVRDILGNPAYRRRATALASDIARHDAPTEAATLLERLVVTGRPVLAR